MATQTFEYCSLHYLNQWLSKDMGYCSSLINGDRDKKLTALKEAGGFYRVARNLPTEYDVKNSRSRYEPVLEIIDALTQSQFEVNSVQEILNIREKISKKYGNRNVLSATTKFLWIKIKQPVLIYDSQVRNALGTKDGDLKSYYEQWRKEFKNNEVNIKDVCSKLIDMNMYAVNQKAGTKDYIKAVSSEVWFHERVFDIYLWNKGNKE